MVGVVLNVGLRFALWLYASYQFYFVALSVVLYIYRLSNSYISPYYLTLILILDSYMNIKTWKYVCGYVSEILVFYLKSLKKCMRPTNTLRIEYT